MAPALSSSSFRLGAAQPHYSKPHHRSPRQPTTAVFARQGGANGSDNGAPFPSFRLGGRKGSESQDEASAETTQKKKPFFVDIDIGKLAGPKSPPSAVAPRAGAGGSPSMALLFSNRRRKDPRSVFVAGAMGQVGVRIARTLLRQGFSVRAGVPELAAAQQLARIAVQYKIISPDESKRLNAVESAFRDAESIARAIGNATKVVVTIGREEDGSSGQVTTDDAFQVVRAAQLAGVGHVTVVYDTSSGLPGPSTYNVLDGITSFFSNLFSWSQPSLTLAEFLGKVAEETELGYTLIKASLGDDGAAVEGGSGGLVVSGEGRAPAAAGTGTGTTTTTSDYKVTKSQIASFVAGVFSNTSVAENKVVEVSTSPSAPSKTVEELFSAIPEDGRRKAYAEAVAKAKAEEEALAASEKALQAAEAAKKLEEEVKKLSEQEAQAASLAEEARQKAEEAAASVENILTRAKGLSADFSWGKLSSQFAAAVAQKPEDDVPKTQVATVRGQAKARTLPPQKAVVKQPPASKPKPKQPEPRAKPRQTEQKAEVRKVFGGLFQQETIYVDDD